MSNNIWTFGQQHLVFGAIEKEEEAKKEETLARRSANAPLPGAKPIKGRKVAGDVTDSPNDTDAVVLDGEVLETDSGPTTPSVAGPGAKPRPGARPNARPKKRKR